MLLQVGVALAGVLVLRLDRLDRNRNHRNGGNNFVVVMLGSLQRRGMTADFLDLDIDSTVTVGLVLHHPVATVGLIQGVRSLDVVTIALFPLGLVIAGVTVLDSVLELVLRVVVRVLRFGVMGRFHDGGGRCILVGQGSGHGHQAGNNGNELESRC